MWETKLYETWIRISGDVWVNTRNVAAVTRREYTTGDARAEPKEGIWVHVGGAKIPGTISLKDFRKLLAEVQ